MKKISLKGVSHILSEKELKNVMGGSFGDCEEGPCYEHTCYLENGWLGTCTFSHDPYNWGCLCLE
jgi:bacteriocin-like protein